MRPHARGRRGTGGGGRGLDCPQYPPGLVGVGYSIGMVGSFMDQSELKILVVRRNAIPSPAFVSRGCVVRCDVGP